jgi:microcystin-dependent protein
MAEPYLSELRIFSFSFAPKGWAQCNGQLLPINQNQALFALLGTTYGGDGRTTFALPNLQGRVPMHIGTGLIQGQSGGEQVHTLTTAEMPLHNHMAIASANGPNVNTPQNNFWASNTGFRPYGNTINGSMNAAALATGGGSQGHSNIAPCLTLNICIAVQGIFPSRN